MWLLQYFNKPYKLLVTKVLHKLSFVLKAAVFVDDIHQHIYTFILVTGRAAALCVTTWQLSFFLNLGLIAYFH